MADNTTLNSGTGGDVLRDKDRAGVKTQIIGLDVNPAGSEVLGTGDATNGLDVDVTRVQGTVTTASSAQAADGAAGLPATAVVVAGYDGTNVQAIVTDAAGRPQVGINGAVPVTDNGGSLTVDGTVAVTGTFWQATQPVSGTIAANVTPATSGGHSISRVISAASTNATSAKASAGQVYGWFISNTNAAPRYLKLYNKASAPTVGTDTPAMTVLIPGNAAGAGANVEFTNGIAFGTGIAYAITTGVADSDVGSVAANEIVINLLYK